jgi:hypothetical protein
MYNDLGPMMYYDELGPIRYGDDDSRSEPCWD